MVIKIIIFNYDFKIWVLVFVLFFIYEVIGIYDYCFFINVWIVGKICNRFLFLKMGVEVVNKFIYIIDILICNRI